MAGMLFFCQRALCYELSVLNPSQCVGNKRGQHRTTVLGSAPELQARNRHWGRNFIHENNWVNLLVLMASSAASRTK